MLEYLENVKRYLWEFVELGFAAILAIMLIYLILGENSGAFVTSVAGNVTKFANAVPTASLIGLAVLLALIYLVMQRMKPADGGRAGKK
jgi:hypothetical protein